MNQRLRSAPRAQRGFTLLELLVVLVVLGLLAGIVAPKYFAQLG
ncbi:MAG: prepilin-type N-terminal cleavage/methylation domain-containing protein, partial [Pseudomonas sp.]